jgi:hypothetical protein
VSPLAAGLLEARQGEGLWTPLSSVMEFAKSLFSQYLTPAFAVPGVTSLDCLVQTANL